MEISEAKSASVESFLQDLQRRKKDDMTWHNFLSNMGLTFKISGYAYLGKCILLYLSLASPPVLYPALKLSHLALHSVI